jgi:pheromone shutdown protein TraB
LRLVIVGTGHILDLAAAIRHVIHTERPAIVALELDPDRYHGLQERRARGGAPIQHQRDTGRVYRYLAKFQESMGESFGVQPGTEMLVAADAAQEVGARIALIDLNAQAVVQQALKRMRFREKLKLVWSSLVSLFPSRQKVQVEAEINKYQENPEIYLDELGRQFPTLRRALIDDRDDHMSAQVRAMRDEPGTVVMVVGDGHVPGLLRRLAEFTPVTHRLKDLRSQKRPAAMTWDRSTTARVTFSFDGQSLEDGLRRERF